MGANASCTAPRLTTLVQTSSGAMFNIYYWDLIDHILLLRQVIRHPESTHSRKELQFFVDDYCQRMANNQLMTVTQQKDLPWQIDWIWHVHRLHPIAYYNDCINQIPGNYFIDKRIRKLTISEYQNSKYVATKPFISKKSKFAPSIDLVEAVLRQKDFLDKFQRHPLFIHDLNKMKRVWFERLLRNYILFMRLAQKNAVIVPTFEIDLMWHTHMRFPLSYLQFSIAVCGILLDHDDSIDKQTLVDNYKSTAERWKYIYMCEYGQNVDPNFNYKFFDPSHCVMICKRDNQNITSNNVSGSGSGDQLLIMQERIENFHCSSGDADCDGSTCGSSCGGGCGGGD